MIRAQKKITLYRLAIPCRRSAVDRLRYCPVLVADLDSAHRDLSSGPSSLEHICATASDRVLRGRADDDGLCADGRKTIDVCTEMDFDDVVLCERDLRLGIGAVGALRHAAGQSGILERRSARTHARGEKWATQLLTEMQVGKAMPLTICQYVCAL